MNLQLRQLSNLPVYTQSGQHLGRVVDFELDSTSQSVLQYHVRSSQLIRELLRQDLLVSREQVVSLTNEKMVVEDSTVPADGKQPVPRPVAPAS
ncbi:MAG: PRC-barrel domain-containing protein [Patescibacteria group bacterium]